MTPTNDELLHTDCCIAGGGPAGMMLGYLLARQGIRVTVLEKHKDFFRDFRGDTVHPSTLQVLHELGLLSDFLKIPHEKVTSAGAVFGDSRFDAADFRHVPAHCKFIALMPQWDFLNFLAERAKQFPSFELRMENEVIDLLRENGSIQGVIARGPENQTVEIRSGLVVGCDGRHSTTRKAAGLSLLDLGVPIDVLWFRISRKPDDPANVLGNVNYGKALILIDRATYFQAGMIVRKGSFDAIKQRGLAQFRNDLLQIAPWLGERVDELRDWDQVKILTVLINRLQRWYLPGLLCIGDAAHAMSPAGGVGINLAIQDAVAAANLLASPLETGRVPEEALHAVQNRREFPAQVTQNVQAFLHRRLARVLENPRPLHAPWQLKAVVRLPGIHRALGYAIGIGVRPEHIRNVPRPAARRSALIKAAIAIGAGAAVAALAVRRFRRNCHGAVVARCG